MAILRSGSKSFAVCLSFLMVITGSVNTLAGKWADSIRVDGKFFNHPILQAICTFIGEFACLVVYMTVYLIRYYRTKRTNDSTEVSVADVNPRPRSLFKFNPFIFAVPAICDVTATSIMFIGLNLTHASSFQMIRGAVIIFTGLFSVAFLGSHLQGFRWFGMGLVCLGLVVVGLSDIVFSNNPAHDINGIITGDLLIIMAQIVVSIQMVVEQRLLSKYDVAPLLAVGLEGLFGMTILTFLLIPMFYMKVPSVFSTNPSHRLEDVFHAFEEIKHNRVILLPLCLTIVSIAFYNFAGVSITKELSATTRMVLDSVRTIVIWIISLLCLEEKFIPAQLIGFTFLILGMFAYNDIIIGPYVRSKILPRMRDSTLTRCCLSCWGLEDLRTSNSEPLITNVVDEEA